MAKSSHSKSVDEIQAALRSSLQLAGFKARGRTFNRTTDDGLTQVVNIQMGASDPPGTTYIPGVRENLHGLFAVNLGVYVPEVAEKHGGGMAKSWVQDYHCCVRERLGALIGHGKEIWWHARADERVIADVLRSLREYGLPFLDRFSSRDKILAELDGRSAATGTSSPARIVSAIILAERNQRDKARELLRQQAQETRNPGHPEYVRKLARELDLGTLDS